MPNFTRTPILLLTGFLGSGKTTLLRALLQGPDAVDTAVIVNEFGEVGLDHNLLLGASETTFVLENGCVCCTVRDDLEASLEDLFWQRIRREIPWFSRVVIETTGLADPYRVVESVGAKSFAAERYAWTSIAATVDGVAGIQTMETHAESVAQATIADHLIVTKTDIADAGAVSALEQRLRILNPGATLHRSRHGNLGAPLDVLMTPVHTEKDRRTRRDSSSEAAHQTDVAARWFRFTGAVNRSHLLEALSELESVLGDRLLRAKGLAELIEADGLAVVQYAAGSPPEITESAFANDGSRHAGLVIIAAHVSERELAQKVAETALGPAVCEDIFPHSHAEHGHPHG